MDNTNRTLQESIILCNLLISIFPKMLSKSDRELYKFVREYTKENVASATHTICDEVKLNLIKEVFTLLNQLWKSEPFLVDEGLNNNKSDYQRIRRDIETSMGKKLPFNNKELFKRIRESIVHNDLDSPNFSFDLDNLQLNLRDGYVITLSLNQFLELIKIILANVKTMRYQIKLSVSGVDKIISFDDIKTNVMLIDDFGMSKPLDNQQVDCIYNFYRLNGIHNIVGNESLFSKAYREANNVKVLIYEKIDTAFLVSRLSMGETFNEIGEKDNIKLVNNYYSLISNLLFTIVSSQSNESIEAMLKDCLPHFKKDDFRHLRNSLAHGRYFHNYRDTFYFYDGKKDLEYYLKLTVRDINRCLDKLAKGRYCVITKK